MRGQNLNEPPPKVYWRANKEEATVRAALHSLSRQPRYKVVLAFLFLLICARFIGEVAVGFSDGLIEGFTNGG